MSHPVDIYRGQWRRCGDCGDSYNDKAAHEKLHIQRPSDSHLTINEAAEALGRPPSAIRYWIYTKKIRFEEKGRGNNRFWITRQAIRNFVTAGVMKNIGSVVEWARTGEVRG